MRTASYHLLLGALVVRVPFCWYPPWLKDVALGALVLHAHQLWSPGQSCSWCPWHPVFLWPSFPWMSPLCSQDYFFSLSP